MSSDQKSDRHLTELTNRRLLIGPIFAGHKILQNDSYDITIQWNLSIADMFYSGHLSIPDTSL